MYRPAHTQKSPQVLVWISMIGFAGDVGFATVKGSVKISPFGAVQRSAAVRLRCGYADRSSANVLSRVIPAAVRSGGSGAVPATWSCGEPGVVNGQPPRMNRYPENLPSLNSAMRSCQATSVRFLPQPVLIPLAFGRPSDGRNAAITACRDKPKCAGPMPVESRRGSDDARPFPVASSGRPSATQTRSRSEHANASRRAGEGTSAAIPTEPWDE